MTLSLLYCFSLITKASCGKLKKNNLLIKSFKYLRSISYTSNIGKSKNYVSLILQKYSLNKICTF